MSSCVLRVYTTTRKESLITSCTPTPVHNSSRAVQRDGRFVLPTYPPPVDETPRTRRRLLLHPSPTSRPRPSTPVPTRPAEHLYRPEQLPFSPVPTFGFGLLFDVPARTGVEGKTPRQLHSRKLFGRSLRDDERWFFITGDLLGRGRSPVSVPAVVLRPFGVSSSGA